MNYEVGEVSDGQHSLYQKQDILIEIGANSRQELTTSKKIEVIPNSGRFLEPANFNFLMWMAAAFHPKMKTFINPQDKKYYSFSQCHELVFVHCVLRT